MLIQTKEKIASSEITDEAVYLNRRTFLGGMALFGAARVGQALAETPTQKALNYRRAADGVAGFTTAEPLTPYEDVISHNNYYEFGTDKSDPAQHAHRLRTEPWSVRIEGEVDKPGDYPLETVLGWGDLQERVYRLRCVEAWSMVIPWIGFPLADLIKQVSPTSKAKFLRFETLHRPEEMPGQRARFGMIDWPYVEGLRMDEAMHPLSLLAVGLYGKTLPNQNGAPLRLVVPWKYGFKSIKSIVKIEFVEARPKTTWELAAPSEYGFYANVNPQVDHPRWSQKFERRLPSGLFSPNRIPTQMFNGYADQVAGLYANLDLRRYF